MSDRLIVVAEYNNPHKADMAKIALESENIPVHLLNRLLVETDWFWSNAIGNIRLQVPAEHAEHARQILAEQPTPNPSVSTDENDDAVTVRCLNCGKPMAENQDTCPACGWSYSNSNDRGESQN